MGSAAARPPRDPCRAAWLPAAAAGATVAGPAADGRERAAMGPRSSRRRCVDPGLAAGREQALRGPPPCSPLRRLRSWRHCRSGPARRNPRVEAQLLLDLAERAVVARKDVCAHPRCRSAFDPGQWPQPWQAVLLRNRRMGGPSTAHRRNAQTTGARDGLQTVGDAGISAIQSSPGTKDRCLSAPTAKARACVSG